MRPPVLARIHTLRSLRPHVRRLSSSTPALKNVSAMPPPPPPPPPHTKPPPSPHAQFYSDLLPAMIPIALLGSAIYLGLELLRSNLAHELNLDIARAHAAALEVEIDALIKARDVANSTSTSTSTSDPASEGGNSGARQWWKVW